MSSEWSALRITVVVPTHNRHEPLLLALRSVARQIRPADEIIVVDDASDPPIELDRSDPFLASVRILRLEVSQEAAAARNAGVEAARSPIIAFLDSDDVYLDAHLADIEAAFRERPDAAFVSTRILVADDALTPFTQFGVTGDEITHAMLMEQGNVVGTFSAIAVARERFLATDGIPLVRAYEDWALILALTERGTGFNIVRPSVVYRSPLLSTLGGISKASDQHMLAFRFISTRFDFARSRRSRTFYNQYCTLLLATAGRRGQVIRHILAQPTMLVMNRLTVMIVLALILGENGYSRLRRANVVRKRVTCAVARLCGRERP